MKQLLIISGKGDTGKTSVAGSFAALADRPVLADCDVDAADLHLLLDPKESEAYDFEALPGVEIDPAACQACGACEAVCAFDAVRVGDHGVRRIDAFACEGCRRCLTACPSGAIRLRKRFAGRWFVSRTRFGPLVHARLTPGEENSGKLVAQVRRAASAIATRENCGLVIIDGPPGIGCPVISAMSGVDLAVIVTEPTVSGLHDLKRVLEVARHFRVPVQVVINKWDLAPERTEAIERHCRAEDIPLAGRIPFDREIAAAIAAGQPPVAGGGNGARAIAAVWRTISAHLTHDSTGGVRDAGNTGEARSL